MGTTGTTPAIAAIKSGPVDAPESFVEIKLELPDLGGHDLLVEVRAVSVNPVDVKVRASFDAARGPKVLGYDAAGIVIAIGSEVVDFAPGDGVYYAGSIGRPGSNAEQHVVDSRIAGHMPHSLDFAQAAAMPLTTITAWESLFDRLRLTEHSAGYLLVVGAPGGVGSMVTQLARARTDVTVIATAARGESSRWVRSLGAHRVVDRHRLREQVGEIAPRGVSWIFSAFSAGQAETYAELMGVGGAVVAIDEPEGLDTLPLKQRSQSWHWEFMFARPLYRPESTYHHDLLNQVAHAVDSGEVKSTINRRLSPMTVETLREAHRLVETSAGIGKVVIET